MLRRMLIDYGDNFRMKKLGVLLFASPSGGSHVASDVSPILSFLGLDQSRTADLLKNNSRYLGELDQEFADLIDGSNHHQADRLNITGVSVAEGEASFLGTEIIVERPSAIHHFSYLTLPADHFSIVKPESLTSRSHDVVADFYSRFTESFQIQSPPLTTEIRPNNTNQQQPGESSAIDVPHLIKKPESDRPPQPISRGVRYEIHPISCNVLQRLHAIPDTPSATVRFINIWPSTIRTFWIDYEGKPKLYATLRQYEAYDQQTNAGHPWAAVNEMGHCVAVFVPKEGSNIARIPAAEVR